MTAPGLGRGEPRAARRAVSQPRRALLLPGAPHPTGRPTLAGVVPPLTEPAAAPRRSPPARPHIRRDRFTTGRGTGGSGAGHCPALLGLGDLLPRRTAGSARRGRGGGATAACGKCRCGHSGTSLLPSLPPSFLPPPPAADENKQRRWRRRWRRRGAARSSEGSGSPGPAPATGRAPPPALTFAARPPGRERGGGAAPAGAPGRLRGLEAAVAVPGPRGSPRARSGRGGGAGARRRSGPRAG